MSVCSKGTNKYPAFFSFLFVGGERKILSLVSVKADGIQGQKVNIFADNNGIVYSLLLHLERKLRDPDRMTRRVEIHLMAISLQRKNNHMKHVI